MQSNLLFDLTVLALNWICLSSFGLAEPFNLDELFFFTPIHVKNEREKFESKFSSLEKMENVTKQ